MKPKFALWTFFAAALIAGIATLAAQPTAAQGVYNEDCYDEKTVTVTQTNPFTGQTVTIERIERVYDQDCNVIRDGRENKDDRAATVAIYCTNAGVDVYDLDISGHGDLAFRATFAEINAVPQRPETNTRIESIPAIALYRLTSGELQVNGPVDWEGKPYVFIWDGCENK